MLIIRGPDLSVKGNLTPDTPWVQISDHYCVKELDNLLKSHGCSQTKILQDFFWLPVDSIYDTVFVPIWLSNFCDFPFVYPEVNHSVPATSSCFNFMVYKLRTSRYQAIQAVLDLGLKTDCYVFPDTAPDLNIQPKFFTQSRQTVYNNVKDYNNFLKTNVFDHSAVSLITETIEPSWCNNMTFTEKTLWAMLSLNFPIWLGGYQQADLWSRVGFDTFDDIINHDYQWNPDPTDRIHQALQQNLKVLTNLNLVADLRKSMEQRLLNNQKLVLGKHITNYRDSLLKNIDIPKSLL